MSMRITVAVGACLAVATAMSVTSAQAQTFYLGGQAGWTVLPDQTSQAAGFPSARSRFHSGFAAGGRVGYEMGPWRFEQEYTYRRNSLNRINWGGVGIAGVKGNRQSHAIMTNLLYSFDLGTGLPVTPHIGGGIGAVNVIDRAASPEFGRFFDDSTWRFGYQAIGGVRYNVTPNVALDLDYRYLRATRANFRVPGSAISYRSGYDTHNLMASLVYKFGPPPPPPMMAPPPFEPPPPPAAAPLPPPPPFPGERG
jgi:OmpA-OmpF porin, OOP family